MIRGIYNKYLPIKFWFSKLEKRTYCTNLFDEKEKLLNNNEKFNKNIDLIKKKIEVLYKDDNEQSRNNNVYIAFQNPFFDHLKHLEDRNKELDNISKNHEKKKQNLKEEIKETNECDEKEKDLYENAQKSLIAYWENLIKGALLLMILLLISRIFFKFLWIDNLKTI